MLGEMFMVFIMPIVLIIAIIGGTILACGIYAMLCGDFPWHSEDAEIDRRIDGRTDERFR
jgi:hypothetical protein